MKAFKNEILLFDDVYTLEEWVESFDLNRPNKTATLLIQKINHFLNYTRFEKWNFSTKHISSLFKLDTLLCSILNSLHKEYIRSGQTRYYAYECRILDQLNDFIDAFMNLYDCFDKQITLCLDGYEANQWRQPFNQRWMYILSHYARICRYQHESLSVDFFNQANQLYCQHYYIQQMSKEEESIFPKLEDSYVNILLFSILELGSYSSEYYPLIDQFTQQLPNIKIVDHLISNASETTTYGWGIDFSKDKYPQRRVLNDHHTTSPFKWLDIEPFLSALISQRKEIESRLATMQDPHLRLGLVQRLACMQKMERDCSPTPPVMRARIASRHIQLECIEWVAGLEAIETMYATVSHVDSIQADDALFMKQLFSQGYLSASSDENRSGADTQTLNIGYLKDVNQYGCAIRIQHSAHHIPAVGMLIVYRRPQQEAWCMGIVRRIRRVLRTEIEVGIEHLGSKWSMVDYSTSESNKEAVSRYAFLFPEDQANCKAYPLLLVPQPDGEKVQPIVLKDIASGVQFCSIVEQKRDWSLLGLDVMEDSPAHKHKTMAA
jgi:hypothetical protein